MANPWDEPKSQGVFAQILRKIPGFAGYGDDSALHASDEQARAWIARHLDSAKRVIDGWARQLVDAGKLDLLPACERLRGRLDVLVSRLRSRPAGGTVTGTANPIGDELLEDLYEFDLWTMDEAEKVVAEMEKLVAAGGEAAAELLRQLQDRVAALEAKLAERTKLMDGHKP